MKEKTILFKSRSRTESLLQPKPYPAAQAVPDWWKSMHPYEFSPNNPEGKKFLVINRDANATFKKCTPMLDGLTSGYIVSLWADVLVTQTEDIPLITWRTRNDVFQLHGISSRIIPAPVGYDQTVFKYMNTWIPITPPGYSTLVTAPFGYQDAPFHAIPAVVDTDKSTLELVFPMWIKSGLEGVVEKGTPLVQLIPFKRDNWVSKFDTYEDGEYFALVEEKNFNSTLISHYIKNHWSKKNYK